MLEVGKVDLRFLRYPKQPSIRIEEPVGSDAYAMFDADAFEVGAAVDLRGDGTGARLGWTQLQTVDIDRAMYRGLTPAAGKVEICRDCSTSAPAKLCRDVSFANDVFTAPPGTQVGLGYTPQQPLNVALTSARLPGTVHVSHADKPAAWNQVVYYNGVTRHPNYLASALVEMEFCAVLLLKHKDGRLQQLAHFYWSLSWKNRFELVKHGQKTSVRRISGDEGNRITFKPFIDGPVTDAYLAALIATPTGQTCNKRAELRYNHPQVHQSAHW